LRSIAERVGGDSLAPRESDTKIVGPEREQWTVALERLLLQLDLTLDDLAFDKGLIEGMVVSTATIGQFLRSVGRAVVERVDAVQLAHELPAVTFIVTSHSEVVGEANRLRRAESYLLGARELLAYSSRSRAGKWWIARRDVPSHHLAYVISLFRARLATMTPSSVAYACAEFGDDSLKEVVRRAGVTRNSGNADRTFNNTDLSHLLFNRTTSELTSTRKGRTSDVTVAAFNELQKLSATRHKALNQSICRLIDRNVPGFRGDLASFENDLGSQDVFADVVVPVDDGDAYLEFHHLSGGNCKAAAMAAYIMEKLQYYAIHYNVVPR
jgi:hypothetical protein